MKPGHVYLNYEPIKGAVVAASRRRVSLLWAVSSSYRDEN